MKDVDLTTIAGSGLMQIQFEKYSSLKDIEST